MAGIDAVAAGGDITERWLIQFRDAPDISALEGQGWGWRPSNPRWNAFEWYGMARHDRSESVLGTWEGSVWSEDAVALSRCSGTIVQCSVCCAPCLCREVVRRQGNPATQRLRRSAPLCIWCHCGAAAAMSGYESGESDDVVRDYRGDALSELDRSSLATSTGFELSEADVADGILARMREDEVRAGLVLRLVLQSYEERAYL